jgi:uroporphyrinogen decarboxylase
MKSKERVLMALHRERVDRVPLDFWATPQAEEKLLRSLSCSEEELMRIFGVDIRTVEPSYIGPPLESRHGMQKNIFGVWEKDGFLGYGEAPLQGISSPRNIDAYPFPDPEWFDVSSLKEQCKKYKDFALRTAPAWGTWWAAFQLSQALRGVETFYIDLLENPDIVNRLLDRITEFTLQVNEKVFRAARGYLDIYFVGDDYGSQNGLLISVDLWRKYFKPRLKLLCEQAKSYGLMVMLHSCGAVAELIPELSEIGVDILNPLQTRARGMSLKELSRFKDLIAFHGGIDTQEVLPFGDEKEVRQEVQEAIFALASSGGAYILASSQELMPDVPVENIVAMYDEAQKVKL